MPDHLRRGASRPSEHPAQLGTPRPADHEVRAFRRGAHANRTGGPDTRRQDRETAGHPASPHLPRQCRRHPPDGQGRHIRHLALPIPHQSVAHQGGGAGLQSFPAGAPEPGTRWAGGTDGLGLLRRHSRQGRRLDRSQPLHEGPGGDSSHPPGTRIRGSHRRRTGHAGCHLPSPQGTIRRGGAVHDRRAAGEGETPGRAGAGLPACRHTGFGAGDRRGRRPTSPAQDAGRGRRKHRLPGPSAFPGRDRLRTGQLRRVRVDESPVRLPGAGALRGRGGGAADPLLRRSPDRGDLTGIRAPYRTGHQFPGGAPRCVPLPGACSKN